MRILPSEVSRTRLQAPQKAWLTRRDDADFADAIGKCVAAGSFAGLAGRHGNERHLAADAFHDFFEGNDDFRRPEAAFFEGHELDESHDNVFFAGEPGESYDLRRR